MENIQKNKLIDGSGSKILLLVILILGLFLFDLCIVSAFDFDNAKSFDKGNLQYGKITITNAFGTGEKLAEYTLTDNSDICYGDCYAEGKVYIYSSGKLFTDMKFVRDKKTKNLDYKLYLKHGDILIEYKGEELSAGSYIWRLEAKKEPYEVIDWIGTAYGKELNEWAIWGVVTFNNSLAIENLTFTGAVSENITRYLDVPSGVVAINGRLNLTGFANATGINPLPASLRIGNTYVWTTDLIALGSFNSSLLSTTGELWTNISIGNGYLEDATQYAMVIDCLQASGPAKMINIYGENTGSYTGGKASRNLSGNWATTNADLSFIVYDNTQTLYSFDPTLDTAYSANGTAQISQAFTTTSANTFSNISMRINRVGSPEICTMKVYKTITESIPSTGNNFLYPYTDKTDNLASTINSYLSGCTYVNGNCSVPFTFHSDNGGNISYFNLEFTNTGLIENSQSYNVSTFETQTESFLINLTYDPTYSISATLIYNNSNYVSSEMSSGVFKSSLSIPTVQAMTNKTFYWRIGLTNVTNTYYFNSSFNNQTVNILNISLCNFPYTVHYINMTIYDEGTLKEINGSVSLTFNYGSSSSGSELLNTFSYSNTTGTKSHYDFCMSPPTEEYKINSVLEYSAPGYVNKFFNFNDVSFTNDTTVFGLYLLNSSDSTSFIIAVKDASYQPKVGVDVYTQRFNAATNTWFTSEISTTDDDGNTIAHIFTEDALYRFKIYEDGELIYTTTSSIITCPSAPCTVTIIIGASWDSGTEPFKDLSGLTATMTYNKASHLITYTYADTNTSFSNGRLYVIRVAPGETGVQPICNSSSVNPSAVLTCDLSSATNGTYMSTGFITRGSTETMVLRNAYNKIKDIVGVIGYDGILWSIFILIGIVMMGIYRPSLGIIFGVVGMILLWLLQLVSVPVTALVAVVGIGIILLIEVRKQ